MKKKVKNVLNRVGIDIRTTKGLRPLDFTKQDIKPLSAFYKAGVRPFFVQVPLQDCRHSLMAFQCISTSISPYIRTLVEYASGYCTTYTNSWLEMVHRRFQPCSAAEIMGIKSPFYAQLTTTPPRGALLPWMRSSPQERVKNAYNFINRENKQHGANLNLNAGDTYFGPASQEKGELEFKRLVNVYESLKETGYQINKYGKDNIGGLILLSQDDKSPRFLCRGGNHRIAALAALGHKYVTLQIRIDPCGGVIRRQDVAYWPTVRAGYLSCEEALTLFDRIFYGEPPINFTQVMKI